MCFMLYYMFEVIHRVIHRGYFMLMETSSFGRGRASHWHMVYITPDGGSGVTSYDRDHAHDVVLVQTQVGNVPVVAPGGADGHTHELRDFILRDTNPVAKNKEELVLEVRSLWTQANEMEGESRRLADESEDFYKGTQWKASDKAALNSEQRAALTINEIAPKIDILSGYQRQNRSDIHYLPVEEGSAAVADILNALVKNICEQNSFEYSETEVFEDMMKAGRGHYNVYIDREDDPQGDIVIERFPRSEVWFGPHEKKDASDAEYVIKSKWVSIGWIKAQWPDKLKDIFPDDTLVDDKNAPHIRVPGLQYEVSQNSIDTAFGADVDFVDVKRKEYRLIECQRKEYRRVPVAANATDGFYQNIEGASSEQLAKLKTIPGVVIIRQRKGRVRVTTIIANALLRDEYPEDLPNNFSVIPAYAYKHGNHWWGKIEGAKDPQRELNKRHSQLIDILNKVSAYGWFIDDSTFATPHEAEKFRRQSAKAGFVQDVRDTNKIPRQAEGVRFPTEMANLVEISKTNIQQILNVNPELLGLNSRAESGVAIVEKKRQGLLGNEFLFDNLNLSKKILGRVLVALIRRCYNTDRIMRVLANINERTPVEIAGQALGQWNSEDIRRILEDADLTKYDVVVAESQFSPTNRIANFIAWSSLASQGLPVPPEMLIELSDLPDKQKYLDRIQQQMQAQQQAEQQKYDTEIQKALIASQGRAGGQQQGGMPMGGMPGPIA